MTAYTALAENYFQDDVHDVHDIHPLGVDILNDATDPRAEEIAAAVKVCSRAVDRLAEDPGIAGSAPFIAAARLLRESAPEEWYAVRGPLKRAAAAAGLKLADIEAATRPAGDERDESSIADELVALVRERADLFRGPDGACYASLTADGPPRTYRLDTRAFSQWAAYAYYGATATERRPGRAASDTAMRTAMNVLIGIATNDGDERPVYLRAAERDGTYYIDLGTDDWSAVAVSPTGWKVLTRPPVHFWRPLTLRPLAAPAAAGDLSLLWRYANIPEPVRPLVLAWMLDAWRPETPFAILELVGQQGTAKSSTQTALRQCMDPNAVDLRAAPRSVEDLYVSAGANWLVSLNNLSHLSGAIQDALCGLATGGGFAGRTLYTNADETLIDAKRPVVINGIVPLVTAQDLTDRVVHVELPELASYRTETEVHAAFERDAPRILGGLLDLFAETLAVLPHVHLERPPRMADYARLGEAMMRAQGHPPGAFLALYQANRRDSIARSLEASPVASAVRQLADDTPPDTRLIWFGTMAALLKRLGEYRDGTEAWPRSARGLGDALRRQRPALAQTGIEVEIGARGRDGVLVRISRSGGQRPSAGEHRERGEHRSQSCSRSALSPPPAAAAPYEVDL